jgi:cell cycle checkpoint protein
MADKGDAPLFSAISSSARQLFMLLRCINFTAKTIVQISEEGMRFSVEESSVMEAMAFLENSLFTSYKYNALSSPTEDENENETQHPVFAVSLPSLLETLQIFGITAENKPNPFSSGAGSGGHDPFHAFSNQVLGVSGLCRLAYEAPGAPLTVIIEEAGIKTTCELNTYEPSFTSDIPFARENIAMKVIMRAGHLFDAIAELSAHSPQIITLSARKRTFTVSASSPLGSATVDFHRDAPGAPQPAADFTNPDDDQQPQATGLLETFLLASPTATFSQSYKFAHIAHTRRALQAATKVSIRADEQGVLSLQFMIENLEGGGVSFVDFRFVPLVDGEDGEGRGGMSSDEDDEDEGGREVTGNGSGNARYSDEDE